MRRLSALALSLILSLAIVGASAFAQIPEETAGDAEIESPPTELEGGEMREPAAAPIAEEMVPTPTPGIRLSLTPQARPTPDTTALSGTTSGSLAGNRAGSFGYASFYYPGDKTTTRITLIYSPNDIEANRGFGLNLYEVSNRAATLSGAGSSPGSSAGTSWVDYSSTTYKGMVTVQVFNYNPGGTITYTIQLSRPAPACASPISWLIEPGCSRP